MPDLIRRGISPGRLDDSARSGPAGSRGADSYPSQYPAPAGLPVRVARDGRLLRTPPAGADCSCSWPAGRDWSYLGPQPNPTHAARRMPHLSQCSGRGPVAKRSTGHTVWWQRRPGPLAGRACRNSPAVRAHLAPARASAVYNTRPSGRRTVRRRLRRSGCPGPPPRRQSQEPSGPLAGSRQEGASGDRGAPGPRPDDSRKCRAAQWPAVGKMTPPAIGVPGPPARTTVAGTERPTGRQSAR